MSPAKFTLSVCFRFQLLCLLSLFWLLGGTTLQAAPAADSPATLSPALKLPANFGEIVYQENPAATSKIFIIANGHRSAINGANTADTVEAQIDTFRIGEWLISQKQIDLLLPEGFFGSLGETSLAGTNSSQLDSSSLRKALTDTTMFVNAELLLHENYGIGLDQIENRTLYRHARERLRSRLTPAARLSPTLSRELAYFQKRRTATILQRAPAIIESAFQQGRISGPNAMLTIGLGHLDDLLAFLQAGEIQIAALQTTAEDFPALQTALELRKRSVGVTVIVPRTLIDRQRSHTNSRPENGQILPISDALPQKST